MRWGGLLAAGLFLVGLWLIAKRWQTSGFHLQLFLATLARADGRWLGAAALLSILSLYGRVLRWAVMLAPIRPHPSRSKIFSATAIGFTALVIFGRPGELVRPYLIATWSGVSFTSQMATWVLERIWDLLLMVALLGFALTALNVPGARLGPNMEWLLDVGGTVVGVVGIICLAALIALHRFSANLEGRLMSALGFLQQHHQDRIAQVLGAVAAGLRATHSLATIFLMFLYSCLEWLIIVASYWCLFRAFPETASRSLADLFVFIGLVSLGSIVQIPGVGGGIQIASAIVLSEVFGLPLEPASGIALTVWVTAFVGIVPVGLCLAFREGINWRSLKRMKAEALV